jgi:hypothetical protein
MAWSRVQSAAGSTSGGVQATLTVSYGSNVSAGNKLIALATTDASGGTPTSVKDGAGNSFTLVGQAGVSATNAVCVTLWAIDVPAGDAGTKPAITYTHSQIGDMSLLIQEVSGLATGNTLAAMVDGTAGTATGTTSPTTSPTYSSTAANEYLVCCFGDNLFGDTYTDPSGYTADPNNITATTVNHVAICYENSTNGAESGQYSFTGTGMAYGVILVAFKLAAAAAVPPPGQQPRPSPHRPPSRALWRGITGPAPPAVAVPAPAPRPAFPRRTPSRAVWRGTPVSTTNAVPTVSAVPPRPPLSLPRRTPARALWRGSAPFTGYVQVPAPRQPPYQPPRRIPGRGLWHGLAVPPITTVPPRQPPYIPPRRQLARAWIKFRPVVTVNATGIAVPAPRQQPKPAPRRTPGRVVWAGTIVRTVNAPPVPTPTALAPERGDYERNRLLRRRPRWLSDPLAEVPFVVDAPPQLVLAENWPGRWPGPWPKPVPLPPEPEPEPEPEVQAAPEPKPEPKLPVYVRPPRVPREYPGQVAVRLQEPRRKYPENVTGWRRR